MSNSRFPLVLVEQGKDAFKQRALRSLTDELFTAAHHLPTVTKQHTVCLEEFLASHSLVSWVQDNLKSETISMLSLGFPPFSGDVRSPLSSLCRRERCEGLCGAGHHHSGRDGHRNRPGVLFPRCSDGLLFPHLLPAPHSRL